MTSAPMFKSLAIVIVMAAFCSSAFAQSIFKFVDKKGTKGTRTVPAVTVTCLYQVKDKSVLDYKDKTELSLCNTSSQGDERSVGYLTFSLSNLNFCLHKWF